MDVQINRDDGLAMLYLFARYKLHPNNMQMNIADKDDAKAIDCRAKAEDTYIESPKSRVQRIGYIAIITHKPIAIIIKIFFFETGKKEIKSGINKIIAEE